MLIARITDADIVGGNQELLKTVSRYGARGILLDFDNSMALMYMSKNGYYKLPGGGIEDNETKECAFLREIKEETGYESKIIRELGYIEEHKYKNEFMQLSYCYIARIISDRGNPRLSNNELSLGFELNWTNIDRALELFNISLRVCEDYSERFMLLREKAIIEYAKTWLSRNQLVVE